MILQATDDELLQERSKPVLASSGVEQLKQSFQLLNNPTTPAAQGTVAAWQIADTISNWAGFLFAYSVFCCELTICLLTSF